MNIHTHIAERCDEAKAAADAGKYHAASSIFYSLHETVLRHAHEADRMLEAVDADGD